MRHPCKNAPLFGRSKLQAMRPLDPGQGNSTCSGTDHALVLGTNALLLGLFGALGYLALTKTMEKPLDVGRVGTGRFRKKRGWGPFRGLACVAPRCFRLLSGEDGAWGMPRKL